MIQVHNIFTTELTKYVLSKMKLKNSGKIMNIASTGSYIPCPYDAVYTATKAYVLFFSKALSYELKNTNITVTAISPGATRTEFAQKSSIENSLLFKVFVMPAEKVAKLSLNALENGKSSKILGIYNKVLVLSSYILPNSLINYLSVKIIT
jgi:short-subunit dehydrogenase